MLAIVGGSVWVMSSLALVGEQGGLVFVCIMSLNGPPALPTDKKRQQLNQAAFKNSLLDETGNLGGCMLETNHLSSILRRFG